MAEIKPMIDEEVEAIMARIGGYSPSVYSDIMRLIVERAMLKRDLSRSEARVAELEDGWNTLGQRIIDAANEWVFDAENNGCGPAYSQLALKLRAALDAAFTGEADDTESEG